MMTHVTPYDRLLLIGRRASANHPKKKRTNEFDIVDLKYE